MTQTVQDLIGSLNSLDRLLSKPATRSDDSLVLEEKAKSVTRKHYDGYCDLLVAKRLLVDLPLKIWDTLERADVCMATFHYFYGRSLYARLRQDGSHLLTANKKNNLLLANEMKLRSLNVYIIERCWSTLAGRLGEHEIDYVFIANVFVCLLLLTPDFNVSRLYVEFYRRQASNIVDIFGGGNNVDDAQDGRRLSASFERLLNIIINTIRCSKIFQASDGQQAMIESQFEIITNKTFCQYSPTESTYRIAGDADRAKLLTRDGEDVTVEYLQQWLATVKIAIEPIFISKLNAASSGSIREIFDEINTIDSRMGEDSRFAEWRIGHNIDVHQTIWKEAILKLFEDRVLQICHQSIGAVEQTLEATLRSSEQFLLDCDLNIVESVWSSPEVSNTNNNNQLVQLVERTCLEIDQHFAHIHREVSILKDNFQKVLIALCSQIDQLLGDSFRSILDRTCRHQKFNLFAAILFKTIPVKCDNVRAIFELQAVQTAANNNASTKDVTWATVQANLKKISDHHFARWFESIVEGHLTRWLEPTQFTELNRFLENLTAWESVPISSADEDDDLVDKKKITSTVNVPTQISLSIYHLLDCICRDINRYCAYNLPRPVLVSILTLLGTKLFDFFSTTIDAIQSKSLPKAAKQTIALQLYFDLLFLKLFYASSKDEEQLRSTFVGRINGLATRLEGSIDPFDLHIVYPILHANAEKLFQSSTIIFGFLILNRFDPALAARATITSTTSNQSVVNNARHNIMLVHSV